MAPMICIKLFVFITCASSRGLYLDIVLDSTNENCIKLLRLFISKGSPQVII